MTTPVQLGTNDGRNTKKIKTKCMATTYAAIFIDHSMNDRELGARMSDQRKETVVSSC